MAEITIDRLALDAPWLSPEEARRLAHAIAAELAAAPAPASGPRTHERVQASVTAAPAGGVDRLARQIVAELLRQLARSA